MLHPRAARTPGAPAISAKVRRTGRYLAGLGLIRLLGEQADPGATAAWTPDGLSVCTTVPDLAEWLWAKSGRSGSLDFDGGVAFRHELASLLLIDGPLRHLLAEAPDQDLG